jgi:hypothetical protein
MVGGSGFSKPQGPEPGEKREDVLPSQRQRVMYERFCAAGPHAYCAHHAAQERKRRPRAIETLEPSPQSGWISNAIWIFHFGRCGFPGVTFQQIPSQRLTAGDEAVMAVRRRERGQEGEGFRAQITAAAADLNPVVIFVVCLFPPAPMADNRFAQTHRAQAKNRPSARVCPVGFEVALRSRKCDKQYRDRGAPLVTLTLPGFRTRRRGPSPPEEDPNWKRISRLPAEHPRPARLEFCTF